MKLVELGDTISRFRFAQSCVGLAGSLCVCFAVWTPFWLKERGLWAEWNNTTSDQTERRDGTVFNGEPQSHIHVFDIFLQPSNRLSKAVAQG